MTEPDTQASGLSSFVRENFIWLLGLLPFVLAGTRLYISAGGDPQTLRFFVQNVNITQLMLATITPLFPVAAFWGAVIYVEVTRARAKQGLRVLPNWLDVPASIVVIALVSLMPTGLLIVNVGLLIVLKVITKFFRWLDRRTASVSDGLCEVAVLPI